MKILPLSSYSHSDSPSACPIHPYTLRSLLRLGAVYLKVAASTTRTVPSVLHCALLPSAEELSAIYDNLLFGNRTAWPANINCLFLRTSWIFSKSLNHLLTLSLVISSSFALIISTLSTRIMALWWKPSIIEKSDVLPLQFSLHTP